MGSEDKRLGLILDIALELGWGFALPQDDVEINGMIIGTDQYIERILQCEECKKRLNE